MMKLILRIKHFQKNIQTLHIFYTKIHFLNFTFKKESYKLFYGILSCQKSFNILYFVLRHINLRKDRHAS